MKRLPILLPVAVAFLLVAVGLKAAADFQAPSDPGLVYVHVTATDRDGRFITMLPKQSFKLSEDRVPQEIVYFSDEPVPVRATVLLDVDTNAKDQIKDAVMSTFRKSSGPGDEILVTHVGNTRLNDAVLQAISNLLQRGNDKKRVFLLVSAKSDPGTYSFSKVKDLIKNEDIQFYATAFPVRPNQPADDRSQNVLRELAELGGGMAFFPSSSLALESMYNRIFADLKYQYLIGYSSTNKTPDGKFRKIKVTAEFVGVAKKVTKMYTRAREGYYAPTAKSATPPKNLKE